jgi:hypothetical protein
MALAIVARVYNDDNLFLRPFVSLLFRGAAMNDSPNRPLFSPYRCNDCGSEVGFRSRRRTLMERYILPLFLLQPVRCGECFRRDYRLVFTSVRDRLMDTPKIVATKHTPTTNRNVA